MAIVGHLGHFGSFWSILGYFGSFWVIFGPFLGANFFGPKIDLCYFYYFLHLCTEAEHCWVYLWYRGICPTAKQTQFLLL